MVDFNDKTIFKGLIQAKLSTYNNTKSSDRKDYVWFVRDDSSSSGTAKYRIYLGNRLYSTTNEGYLTSSEFNTIFQRLTQSVGLKNDGSLPDGFPYTSVIDAINNISSKTTSAITSDYAAHLGTPSSNYTKQSLDNKFKNYSLTGHTHEQYVYRAGRNITIGPNNEISAEGYAFNPADSSVTFDNRVYFGGITATNTLDRGTNKYFATDGSIQTIPVQDLVIEVLHDELANLVTSGNLIPGAMYRITDYAVVLNPNIDFASPGDFEYDIVVTALSTTELSENASAMHHGGSSYLARAKYSAWELKYCLSNDSGEFDWEAGAGNNGKGVVYYLKDEFGNEAPFDFKNILFNRYKIVDGAHENVDKYGVTEGYGYTVDGNEAQSMYLFTYSDGNGGFYDASETGMAHGNSVGDSFNNDGSRVLQNVVFVGTNEIKNNKIGTNCDLITIYTLKSEHIRLEGECSNVLLSAEYIKRVRLNGGNNDLTISTDDTNALGNLLVMAETSNEVLDSDADLIETGVKFTQYVGYDFENELIVKKIMDMSSFGY